MQNINISNREQISIDGVKEVGEFNEELITVYTEEGEIKIKGEALKVIKFDNLNFAFEAGGHITGIFFSDKLSKKEKFVERLFK